MKVLVIGSGGREHAVAQSIVKSKNCSKVFILPGNAGTATIGENILGDVNDFKLIKNIVLSNQISVVFVGPEDPIVNGIYDFFKQDKLLKDVLIIAPGKTAAKLEGSKDFAKIFMSKNKIPTAKYSTFAKENIEQAYTFLDGMNPPYVLKADGLAAGKGVLIIDNIDEAKKELDNMLLKNKFGKASNRVVIEEFLDGIELSCFVLTNGKDYKILPLAKDYKKIGEGDTGLNTGGMGAISPVPFADKEFKMKIEDKIIKPTIKGIQNEGMHYTGFIFIGLIKVKGEPYVIEYNVRMGDPETEVVFPRIKSDILALFLALETETFPLLQIDIDPRVASTVMLVSGGYPLAYEKNASIIGLDDVSESLVFHAATKNLNNKTVTNGGRVLAITSYGSTINNATKNCYEEISKIFFEGMYYRKDIGFDL
ncbi:MAG: phosphoribosylamine--glycine ligase [Pelagibacterales bacterium]|nr:phosphoribosylamine--glycine ligase [Pelagibacterales bacterium]